MSDDSGPEAGEDTPFEETVHRLRLRAAALRDGSGPAGDDDGAAVPADQAEVGVDDVDEATEEPPVEAEPEPDDEPEAAPEPEAEAEPQAEPEGGFEDDGADDDLGADAGDDLWDDAAELADPTARARVDLLTQWADEEHIEADAPRLNWSSLLAPLVILALLAAAVGIGWVLIDRSGDDGPGDTGPRGEDAEASSILAEDPPSLDDLTADITVPPGPEVGLQVVEQGVTIVEDRFDDARREGTFAVIVENPNLDQVAQNVQIDVDFLDAAGTVLGSDTTFVQLVLPGERVAVADLVFDAPTVEVDDLGITIDVARWREAEPAEGTLEILTSETIAAEFSGLRTAFELRSSYPDALVDVGVTAVYRRTDGSIIGGADIFLDLVEPGVPTPGEVVLLANVDIDDVATTELYPAPSLVVGDPAGG